MSNPFRVFRRHQKGLLAVLGLMAMVSFVVLPIYLQNLGAQRRRNPVVVSTTRYGNLDEDRLRILRSNHAALEQFFEQLSRRSQQAQGDPSLLEQMKAMLGSNTEREVVGQWLLDSRAEELGLDIGEDAITHYLNEALTAAKISNEQYHGVLQSVGISEDQLFSLLRQQFLGMRLMQQFNVSLAATTPEQRWDYYQRLHRRAAIEVAGLPVSDYAGDVNDPGDAVLKAYFEKFKTHLHNPALPTPGFKEPKRVAFEYLKADYSKLTELAKIPEEEIQKYYREHKEDLYKQTLPELPGKQPLTPPAPLTPAKPAKEKPATPADTGTRGHGDAEKAKPGAEKPAAEKPATPADTGTRGHGDAEKDKPGAEKPAGEKPAGEKPDSNAAGKSSALPSRSPFHLTAYADDSSSEKKPEGPASNAPGDKLAGKLPESKPGEKPAAKPAAKADKKAEEKPDAKPEEKPAAKPAASGEKKQPAAAAKQEPPPPTYKPLEKVRDEIRRQLARDKVHDRLEDLRQQFQAYHGDLAIYESQGAEENAKPPVRPDFKKLAKETGLEARDSGGLLDVFEAKALDIGNSYVEGRSEFVSVVYQKLPEFLPRISSDLAGNQYLFWKTKETAEEVPEWTDKGVREKVLAAWKLEQARSIAEKEAERLARIARQSKQPLEKVFARKPQVHVYRSDPFTWLTEGAIPGSMSYAQPEISQIRAAGGAAGVEQAVETPGNGFMQAVFHRDRGDVGVARNQPETMVYVFRVTEMTPASWDAFVSEGADSYSLFRVSSLDRERVGRAWFKSIEETAGLKWEREAVEAPRGEE